VTGALAAAGKATTAAMLASMLKAAGEDVIAVVGEDVPGLTTGGGAVVQQPTAASGTYTWPRGGLRQRLVIAADDQDGAFLGLKPSILVRAALNWPKV
jgi:UDP-N-acetylmuramate-alanine ligase